MPQTPRGTLGQICVRTNFFQILTMFDHVSEVPKVLGLVRISPISGDLQSFGDVVKCVQNSIKIGMHLYYLLAQGHPCSSRHFAKKIGLAYIHTSFGIPRATFAPSVYSCHYSIHLVILSI